MGAFFHTASLLVFCLFLANLARAEERILIHNGRERQYLIDMPQPVAAGKKLPVIIVLHGGGGNGENVRRMTGFTQKAASGGAIAVYPTGSGRFPRMKFLKTWNAGHCCGYAMDNAVDDVGFISALIDELVAKEGADPKRIFVTGMSNGAMMAERLGGALSGKIAAIAPVVGGLFGDEPKPVSPVSALIINGALDRNVPPAGGLGNGLGAKGWDGTPLKPTAYQGHFWAAANGCDPNPAVQQEAGGKLTVTRYHCPAGREVVRYLVNDNAHAWPGGKKGSRLGDEPSASMNATDVIWDFFMRQSR